MRRARRRRRTRVKACNIPLQVGVGLAGGAEVAIQLLQEHLRRNPGHAIASDDKRNGFNEISREATSLTLAHCGYLTTHAPDGTPLPGFDGFGGIA